MLDFKYYTFCDKCRKQIPILENEEDVLVGLDKCCMEYIEEKKAIEREREEKEREREFESIIRKIVSRAGAKYEECSFDSYEAKTKSQESALAIAREFAKEPNCFISMYGNPGTGKTHLAVSIFRSLATEETSNRHGPKYRGTYDLEFWSVPELLLSVRSKMQCDVSEEESIAPLLRAKLLILDDFGAEKMTDWAKQLFYVIISHREKNYQPTVFTSNLSLGEIESRVGDDRITSRIGGAARIVKIDGKDHRLENRGK